MTLCRRTLEALEAQGQQLSTPPGWQVDVDLRHGDLRDQTTLQVGLSGGAWPWRQALGKDFDLVTANPPYLAVNSGNLPSNSQKAYCRHELRGGCLEPGPQVTKDRRKP